MKKKSKPGGLELVLLVSWITYLGYFWPFILLRNDRQFYYTLGLIVFVSADVYLYVKRKKKDAL